MNDERGDSTEEVEVTEGGSCEAEVGLIAFIFIRNRLVYKG